MKTIVVYHRADFDGLFSAAVCKKFLPEDTEFIGWDFGDPIPEIDPDVQLYIVDLSIEELMRHKNLIWIDHHKSAIDKYHNNEDFIESRPGQGAIEGYRIDGVAACRLCWQWFMSIRHFICQVEDTPFILPNKEDYVDCKVREPLALTLAGQYDVWDLRDNRAMPFQFGLNGQKYFGSISLCLGLLEEEANDFVDTVIVGSGRLILDWQQEFAAGILKERGYQLQFEGLNFCVLGSVHARSSMWFPTSSIPEGTDALMSWRYDGTKVAFSLYHAPGKEHHDLSQIAVKYGGGGHRGAAGFLLSLEQAVEIIDPSKHEFDPVRQIVTRSAALANEMGEE